jgi:hypothetical protein
MGTKDSAHLDMAVARAKTDVLSPGIPADYTDHVNLQEEDALLPFLPTFIHQQFLIQEIMHLEGNSFTLCICLG